MGESWVRQEYLCSFEALEGLVYPDFEEQCRNDHGRRPWAKRWAASTSASATRFVPSGACSTETTCSGSTTSATCARRRSTSTRPPCQETSTSYADPAGATENGRAAARGPRRPQGEQRHPGRHRRRHRPSPHRPAQGAPPELPQPARRGQALSLPRRCAAKPTSEIPIDDHNHALAALRYLVSRVDAGFVARFRRRGGVETKEGQGGETPDKSVRNTGPDKNVQPTKPRRPYLSVYNEDLWTRLF